MTVAAEAGEGARLDRPRRRGRWGRWGRVALQLGLTVVVTWFIVNRVGVTLEDLTGLDERWLAPRWSLLAAASALLVAGFVASALLWGRMVRELGGPRLGLRRAASIYFASNLGRYVPGKVWQLAGLTYLARREGVPAPLASGAAVLVQALSLAGAAIVGAWTLLRGLPDSGAWGIPVAALLVVLVLGATLPPVFRRLVALWFRLAGGEAPPPIDTRPSFGLRWIAFFCGNWVIYGAAFWLMALSFGVPGPFTALAPAFAAAYVLGYAVLFAPAGIGVREGFLIAFLQPVTGVAAATATAIVARFWMTILELVPALVFAGARAVEQGRGEGGGDR